MKISIKNTSKILGLFLLTGSVWAAGVGRVSTIKGHAFIMVGGETKVIQVGDELPAGSDLISEEGSQVTFNDFADHRFHLSGSGHLNLKDKDFELKRGYLWVQSYNAYAPSQIKTANSLTTFSKSEFILSFDNNSGRTQILAVTGPFEFANLLEKNLVRSVETGNFSFIDKDYEQGMPRKGTLIGYQSYSKIVGLFENVKPLDGSVVAVIKGQSPVKKVELSSSQETLTREIASLSPEVKAAKEKILAQVGLKTKWKKGYKKTQSSPLLSNQKVEMKVYGLQSEILETMIPNFKVEEKRTPASVVEPVKAVETQTIFEQSLKQEEVKQPRHESEVNKLIDDLKSYQSDFTKEY
jgi:hypothetical protein